MRSLIVFVLLALALPSLAVDICPSGSLFESSVYTNSPGQSYTATGCTFNSYNTLSASDTPAGSAPISITIEDSVVNGFFEVYFPSLSRASTRPPMHVTIQKNVFNNGAVFYVSRSLPPNSIVTFQNNQMSSNGTIDNFGNGLAILVYFESVNVYPNTTINILSNTLTLNAAIEIGTQLMILYVYTVTDNCTVNVLDNTIKANATSGGFLMHTGWYMGENSTLRIDSNTLIGNTTEGSLNAFSLNAVGGIQSSDLQRSFLVAEIEGRNDWVSVSNNDISVFGGYTTDQVIYIDQAEKVNLRIDGNTITTNNGYFIYSEGDISPPCYASIIGNTFAFTRSSLTTSPIYLFEYEFAPNSTLVIASNTFTAPTVTETPLFVEIDRSSFDSTASIKHCGNTLPWTNASTTVNQLFSTSLVELVVYDENACVGTISTTRAPSSFAKINALVAISCLFAAVVALLL